MRLTVFILQIGSGTVLEVKHWYTGYTLIISGTKESFALGTVQSYAGSKEDSGRMATRYNNDIITGDER